MKKIITLSILCFVGFAAFAGEIDSLRNEVKKLSENVDELNKLKDNIILIASILGISFTGIFAYVAWKFPTWAKEQITKKVNDLNGSAKDEFKKIRIAIVNLNGSKDLNSYLKDLGFEASNIKNFAIGDTQQINKNETDLIFFDNEKNELSDENIKKVIDSFLNQAKFGYLGARFVGDTIFPFVKPASSSRETLNGNLLKLIKAS